MARLLTPKDGYAIMNLLVKEATGADSSIQAVDSSTFISAGESVLATGIENTLNSLSIVLGRTFTNVRPYNAKFNIITMNDTGLYGQVSREILVYSRPSQAAGDFNTDLYTNFAQGYDNGKNPNVSGVAQSVATMWEQNQPITAELFFGGSTVWDECTTIYEDQLKVAFADESSFVTFLNAVITEKYNDMERTKEAFARMTLLNHMAGIVDASTNMPESAVNLTDAFNTKYGTNYSTADLLSTYYSEFLAFFIATVKKYSDLMTESTKLYHWTPAKTVDGVSYDLLRDTPKERQKLVLYGPMFIDAESEVLPEVFNDQYLKLDNFERVNYWQNINDPMAISVTPAIPDFAGTGSGKQTVGSAVSLSNVVGMLFDESALAVNFQFMSADTTPLEARKRYRNTWWHNAKNGVNNFTRPAILFYMAD